MKIGTDTFLQNVIRKTIKIKNIYTHTHSERERKREEGREDEERD